MSEVDESAIEVPDMPEEERRVRLAALAERLFDPGGLDWETLENIEALTERVATEEEVKGLIEWFSQLDDEAEGTCGRGVNGR